MIANGDDETGDQIPLGPALIAWAVLLALGLVVAGVVTAFHKWVEPIPFW